MSRDLPMPASPESKTTWPSPVFALDQRRSSNSDSSSRPTRAVRPVACIASKRPSAELARRAAHARVGPAMPLRSLGPRSSRSKRLPSNLRVLSQMTTMFGSATPCRRAARFGVLPTMLRSCADPEPMSSPMTTCPVAIPIRVRSKADDLSADTALISSSPARTARSASSS